MPQLLTRILSYLRRNVIAFVALFFALGAGGGYAIAARRHTRAGRLVASYETAVLTLPIPVAESAKPRKVQLTEGADEGTIEVQTTQTGA